MTPLVFEKPRRKFAKAKIPAPNILLLMAGSFGVWLERREANRVYVGNNDDAHYFAAAELLGRWG
jgi:hypothetical protein